jgi:hypothetical protein
LVIHRLKPSPLASLSIGFWRLFGLIFWSFRLHGKNSTARDGDANLFCVFRSGLRDINGPEALSSRCLQFSATDAAAWHLVNAIRPAFVTLPECFASFLSLAKTEEIPKADKATIKITERRKSLGFMIQVRFIREYRSGRFWCKPESSARVVTGGAKGLTAAKLKITAR